MLLLPHLNDFVCFIAKIIFLWKLFVLQKKVLQLEPRLWHINFTLSLLVRIYNHQFSLPPIYSLQLSNFIVQTVALCFKFQHCFVLKIYDLNNGPITYTNLDSFGLVVWLIFRTMSFEKWQPTLTSVFFYDGPWFAQNGDEFSRVSKHYQCEGLCIYPYEHTRNYDKHMCNVAGRQDCFLH